MPSILRECERNLSHTYNSTTTYLTRDTLPLSVMSKIISGPSPATSSTPASTAPTSPISPTSPTSSNGLIDCNMNTGPDKQYPECNENGNEKSAAVRPTGHYITQVTGRFHETKSKQVLRTISLSARSRATGKDSRQQQTPLGRRPSIGKRMEGRSSYSGVRSVPARPCIR